MAKKRTDGMGSVKKLPSGNWQGQIMDGYKDNGKRNLVTFSARTKGEVMEKIRQYWLQKELVQQGAEFKKVSFEEWANTWYEDYRTQVQPSTYSNYQYTLNALKRYFSNTPIQDLKPMDINRFHNYLLNSGMSKSYNTKCRAMLIQIFDAADANELIPYNPARKAKAMKVIPSHKLYEDEDSAKDAFNDTELEWLKKGLPDNVVGHSIHLMLGTGMRSQELLALMPQDIAEDGSTITISKAIKMVDGVPKLGPPKSKRGKRIVPVPEDYRTDAIYLREHSGKPYIWTSNREDGLFDVGAFRKRYYRTIEKIPGVRRLSPHCCRHTYISNLEKKGVPMEQIARLAGHSRISTTDGYLHTDMDTLSNAVSVLNSAHNTTT